MLPGFIAIARFYFHVHCECHVCLRMVLWHAAFQLQPWLDSEVIFDENHTLSFSKKRIFWHRLRLTTGYAMLRFVCIIPQQLIYTSFLLPEVKMNEQSPESLK
uniref:Uncharacterized protein n=1 Tax=Parascaris univalens TaxID=6257 RepID=A0A915A7I6_PARUN